MKTSSENVRIHRGGRKNKELKEAMTKKVTIMKERRPVKQEEGRKGRREKCRVEKERMGNRKANRRNGGAI